MRMSLLYSNLYGVWPFPRQPLAERSSVTVTQRTTVYWQPSTDYLKTPSITISTMAFLVFSYRLPKHTWSGWPSLGELARRMFMA